jgi:hypothetical protein
MCTMLSRHVRDGITAFTDHEKQTLSVARRPWHARCEVSKRSAVDSILNKSRLSNARAMCPPTVAGFACDLPRRHAFVSAKRRQR